MRVDLTGREPVVRPSTELGACISGQVAVRGAAQEKPSEDFELLLRSELGNANPATKRARSTRMRLSLPLAEGRFSTGALPLPMEYVLTAEDPILAGTRVTVGELQPGEDRAVAVVLTQGGSLSGRVLTKDAQPVSGATVRASISGGFFGMDNPVVREVETDPSGAFELTGVPAASIRVVAEADGMLPSNRLTATTRCWRAPPRTPARRAAP